MLTLVLAESSIERIPERLRKHPSVVAHAKKRGKDPSLLILDRSYHHSAMRTLEDSDPSITSGKHGRPDIAFHVLLQALGCPLSREGLLRTYVHTVEDRVIEIDPAVRLPRNYDRFIGILEQLYEHQRVPLDEHPLLSLRQSALPGLIRELEPSMTLAFSTVGTLKSMRDACSHLLGTGRPVALIGGFARSHFDQSTLRLADRVFSIDKEGLDAWVVAARLVYEYECGLGLPEKRIRVSQELCT